MARSSSLSASPIIAMSRMRHALHYRRRAWCPAGLDRTALCGWRRWASCRVLCLDRLDRLEILIEARRHVPRHAVDAYARGQAHQARAQQGVLPEVDRLTVPPISTRAARRARRRRRTCARAGAASDIRSAPPWSATIASMMSLNLRAAADRPSTSGRIAPLDTRARVRAFFDFEGRSNLGHLVPQDPAPRRRPRLPERCHFPVYHNLKRA